MDKFKMLPSRDEKLLITLNPRRVRKILLFVVIGFFFAHLLTQFSQYFLGDYPLKGMLSRLFNVDREDSIPTLYSVCGLLFSSILLGLIAYTTAQTSKSKYTLHWFSLALIFLCLSIDEASSLHERLIIPLRSLLNTSGFLFYAWVIPGVIFVAAFLLVFRNFILALSKQIRNLFLLAGTFFVSGAIGVELIGGFWHDVYGMENFAYAIIVAVEEFLEMSGVLIFIYALILHLSSLVKTLYISLES